jgi:malonyl-CoA/methylmalonyl-CoA synthetase
MFFGVPTMYVRLLELPDPVDFPRLRLCVSGSAALSPEVFDRFAARFGITILERYGATEFGFALGNRFGGPRVPGSVGVPFPGVRVRVAGVADGRPLEAGSVGELLVSGPNVFAGYWRDAAATAAAFVTDSDGTRWYRSGDLASYDPQRQVYRIVGRLKELIISGGFNIYPLEVENEIDRFPGVRASAVVGAPDAARGESVVAFVEAEPGLPLDRTGLEAWLRTRLASFKVPKRVTIVDALPRNALGKVEKPKLRALL